MNSRFLILALSVSASIFGAQTAPPSPKSVAPLPVMRQVPAVPPRVQAPPPQQRVAPPPPVRQAPAAPPRVQAPPSPQQRIAPAPLVRQAPVAPVQRVAPPPVRIAPVRTAMPPIRTAAAYPGHAQFSREVRIHGYRPSIVSRVPLGHGYPPVTASYAEQERILGPVPGPGFVFIPGYYAWSGATYVWYEPVWAEPPFPGVVWMPPYWENDNGQWAMQEGYWMRPDTVAETALPVEEAPPAEQPEPPSFQQEAQADCYVLAETHPQGWFVCTQSSAPEPPPPPPTPASMPVVPLANGQVVMEPFATTFYQMNVPGSGWRMVGDFNTNSPDGVVVFVDNGKQKGRKTTRFFGTPVETAGSVDFPFPYPGTFFLYFQNFSEERIYLNLNFSYQQ